jgi:hypothetical protein
MWTDVVVTSFKIPAQYLEGVRKPRRISVKTAGFRKHPYISDIKPMCMWNRLLTFDRYCTIELSGRSNTSWCLGINYVYEIEHAHLLVIMRPLSCKAGRMIYSLLFMMLNCLKLSYSHKNFSYTESFIIHSTCIGKLYFTF